MPLPTTVTVAVPAAVLLWYVGSPEFTIPTDLLDGLLTQPSLLEREG